MKYLNNKVFLLFSLVLLFSCLNIVSSECPPSGCVSNVSINITGGLILDPTNPNLIILYPTNKLSISGSSAIPLNFSANDTNIDTCSYNLKKSDGTYEITDFAINCSENTTFDVSIYDTFTLNFTVNDTAGNSNSSQINFTVTQPDSSAPPSEGTGNDGTGSGGTSTFNKTLVCEFAEQFLREHITIVGFDYSHDDIVNLTDLINVYSRPNIQISTTELYLKNFELQCNRTNPEFLKIEEPSNFTFITVHAANLTCNGQINKKAELNLGLFTMKFDMDWYIPFLKIDTGEMTCASLNFWSWIFKYENNGDDFYTEKGIKIWWILSLGILILLWWIFIGRFRQNKKINKLIDKKLKT